MFGFSRKKYIAVTLFEMLLVLFISSMVAVSTFKAQQQQSITAVAGPLAQRMYLYAQTVRQYVTDNQAAILAGTLAAPTGMPTSSTFVTSGTAPNLTYTITGISWLQTALPPGVTTPYLPPAFTFGGLNPLVLQRGSLTSDAAIQVQISPTQVIISFGSLYDVSDGKPQAAVTAMAAQQAGKTYDPVLGVSTFSYVGGLDASGALLPITATWNKAQTAETHLNNTTDVGGDLNVTGDVNLSASTDSGSGNGTGTTTEAPDITGVGSMAFDSNTADTSVDNLNTVNFGLTGRTNTVAPNTTAGTVTGADGSTTTGTTGGEINNLGDVNMVGDGTLDGVQNLNFSPSNPASSSAGSGNTITGLQTLTFSSGTNTSIEFPSQGGTIGNVAAVNFTAGGAINNLGTLALGTPGTVTGIKSLQFQSGGTFGGIIAVTSWNKCGTATEIYPACSIEYDASRSVGMGYYTNAYICSLSNLQFVDGNYADYKSCNLSVDATGQYVMNFNYVTACGALCVQYNNFAVD